MTAGVPSVFVRLALCNLRCSWCDTKYTWDWRHYDPKEQIVVVDADEVLSQIAANGAANVVITGGEPLLQKRELKPLAESLKDRGQRIEVETNGTILPSPALRDLVDQWNVSPKLANSGGPKGGKRASAALRYFADEPKAFFKFVIVEPADVQDVREFVAHYEIEPSRVVLMPEGRSAAVLMERTGWLTGYCLELGFRYGSRLHVLLWGDQRGR